MSQTIDVFNKFCNKINSIYSDNKTFTDIIDKVLLLEDSEKQILINNMYQKFTMVDNNQELLNFKKVKLFSSKEEETYQLSCSLFGEDLTLKKIFNPLKDKDKEFMWISLKVLIECVKPKKTKNAILNMEVDENVNLMIDDIVSEFKTSLNNKTNPLESIFGITTKITEKYQDKLTSGEIQLDGLVQDLQNKMPGVKNIIEKIIPTDTDKDDTEDKKDKIIIDENFSTETVTTGIDKKEENSINISKYLPMINGLTGKSDGSALPDISSLTEELLGGDLGDMLNMVQNVDDIKNKKPEEIKAIKEKMDKMMKEKFNIDIDNIKNTFEKSNKTDL